MYSSGGWRGLCFWLLKFANGFYQKMQTCWPCYSSSCVLFIPQTALTEAAFSCREAVLPGLTVCCYQLHSKSLSVPGISGGFAVSPFAGNVVCLSLNCFCWSFLFFSQSSFAKFFPYLLINPFSHQASVILLKYNLIFFSLKSIGLHSLWDFCFLLLNCSSSFPFSSWFPSFD